MSSPKEKGDVKGLFKFADWYDVVLMVLGTVGAVGDGCSTNFLLLSASSVMNSLGYGSQLKQNHGVFMPEVAKVPAPKPFTSDLKIFILTCHNVFGLFRLQYCLYFVYTGLAVLGLAFLGTNDFQN